MSSQDCLKAAPAALITSIEQFNQGGYYECHDILEELWMAESRPIRDLYKGILQIGVAFYHLQHKRYRPVVTLLQRGSGYVRAFAPTCMGLDLDQLLADAGRCLSEVERLGPDGVNGFDWSGVPKILYKDSS